MFCPFKHFLPESVEWATDPSRLPIDSDVLFPMLRERQAQTRELSTERLLSDDEFAGWARGIGTDCWRSFNSDIALLWQRGWLQADEVRLISTSAKSDDLTPNCRPLATMALGQAHPKAGRWRRFDIRVHRFRLFPFHCILHRMDWTMTRTAVLYPSALQRHTGEHIRRFKMWLTGPNAIQQIRWWNGIADLAIILEPLYWPTITAHVSRTKPKQVDPEVLRDYREFALATLAGIPKAQLAQAHEELRFAACRQDSNGALYLLMRTTNWYKRDQLTGAFAGALWLRHIAEVLRRGFDELYEDRLVHEDEGFGVWVKGMRALLYGSDYPLDNPADLSRRIVNGLGIPSTRVRIYVEGSTEAGAIKHLFEGLLGSWVEIVNLKAQFGEKKGGYFQNLREELERDRAARRYSCIAVDADNDDLVRSLRAMVGENLIVGMILMSNPDFETQNFTVEQLIRAAEFMEAEQGFDCLPLDRAAFSEVSSGKQFQDTYCSVRQAPGLKGEKWGQALARIAYLDRTNGEDEQNPFVHFANSCLRTRDSNYDAHIETKRIDPQTFELDEIKAQAWEADTLGE